MERWSVTSSRISTRVGGVFSFAFGCMIAYAAFHVWSGNLRLAAAVLSLLPLGFGAWLLIADPRETLTVDPRARRLFVDKSTRLSRRLREIAFDEVERFYVDEIQHRGRGPNFSQYFTVARLLGTGEEVRVFAPTVDRDEAYALHARLASEITHSKPLLDVSPRPISHADPTNREDPIRRER